MIVGAPDRPWQTSRSNSPERGCTEWHLDGFSQRNVNEREISRSQTILAAPWTAVNFHRGIIRIEPTQYFDVKTDHSIGDAPVDPEVLDLRRRTRVIDCTRVGSESPLADRSRLRSPRPADRVWCFRVPAIDPHLGIADPHIHFVSK